MLGEHVRLEVEAEGRDGAGTCSLSWYWGRSARLLPGPLGFHCHLISTFILHSHFLVCAHAQVPGFHEDLICMVLRVILFYNGGYHTLQWAHPYVNIHSAWLQIRPCSGPLGPHVDLVFENWEGT